MAMRTDMPTKDLITDDFCRQQPDSGMKLVQPSFHAMSHGAVLNIRPPTCLVINSTNYVSQALFEQLVARVKNLELAVNALQQSNVITDAGDNAEATNWYNAKLLGTLGERIIEIAIPRAARMPYLNRGYDFEIDGRKIEVKTSLLHTRKNGKTSWCFHAKKNDTADELCLVCFGATIPSGPIHVYRLPAKDFRCKNRIFMSPRGLYKFAKNEYPMDLIAPAWQKVYRDWLYHSNYASKAIFTSSQQRYRLL